MESYTQQKKAALPKREKNIERRSMERMRRVKERRAQYFLTLAVSLMAVLFLGVCRAEAASKLALFNFASANDMKVVKGAKIDLSGNAEASAWSSSNSKIVKVTKSGVITAVKPGKAVISAKIDGQKEECKITVVKDVLKSSSYLKNVYRTWNHPDSGKKVTVKSGALKKGMDDFLSLIEPENDDDVVYKKGAKITAIEEDSAGATVYFEAPGIFNGKESYYPCAAVFTNDYEHEKYDYSLMLQPVTWVTDDGGLLYGAGIFWYA